MHWIIADLDGCDVVQVEQRAVLRISKAEHCIAKVKNFLRCDTCLNILRFAARKRDEFLKD
eukprot:2639631-Rhodomonas_salina.1